MTGNNTIEVKSVKSGFKIKAERKDDEYECSATIPTSWKKFGEVYYNDLDQPVFVCSICLEDAETIGKSMLFSTYDISEFLFHLQHHFITLYSKSVDGISIDKNRHPQKKTKNSTSTKSTDIHPVKIEKNPIGTSGGSSEKFVDNAGSSQTKELYQIDIKEEIQDDYWEQPSLENINKSDSEGDLSNIKEDEMSRFTFSNSNYYYDDQNYNISDDEYDEDETDNFDEYENEDFGLDDSKDIGDFLKNTDSVEISDEDGSRQGLTQSDTDKTDKIKKPIHTNEENEDADIYFYKCTVCSLAFGQRIDLLKHMRSHKKEDISLNNKKSPSINGIPTPEASPCDPSTKQRQQYNHYNDRYDENLTTDQSQYKFPSKQKSKHSRPFRSFQCKICGKRTATEHTMQTHQRRFHSSVLEKDSIANQYTFEYFHKVTQPEQYIRQRTSDRGVKGQLLTRPFQCKICNKRTGTQQAMKLHQQRFHSSATHLITTQCEICHKRIFTPKLQQHMIVHRAAQYKCDYCGLIYKHKQSLTIHIKKFHPNSS